MEITLCIDPGNADDLEEASALLDHLHDRISPPDPGDLVSIVRSLMVGYGRGRLGYIELVADAGDGGAPADVVAAHFGGKGRSIGGTHASIEKSWRALGGEEFFPKFIETDDNGTHKMNPLLRSAVAHVSAELGK